MTLCDTPNYQKASELLSYAPSTLCKHVQAMENELGVALFEKEGRGLRLTDAGAKFQVYARRLLDDYTCAYDSLRPSPEELPVTFAGCELNIANCLLDMITSLSRAHKEVRFNSVMTQNADIPRLMTQGAADIGFVYSTAPVTFQGLQTTYLYKEPLYLMVSESSPMLEKEHIGYQELSGMELVYLHDTCCFSIAMMQRFATHGAALRGARYLGSVHMVVDAVAADHSLFTLAPYSACRRYEKVYGLKKLPLEDTLMVRENLVSKDPALLGGMVRTLISDCRLFAKKQLSDKNLLPPD